MIRSRISRSLPSVAPIVLKDKFADLPTAIQKEAEAEGNKDGEGIKDVFHDGTIFLVLDNIQSWYRTHMRFLYETRKIRSPHGRPLLVATPLKKGLSAPRYFLTEGILNSSL